MSFIQELKRRNVFRVGIAYVLAAWVLLQIADFMLDLVGAPNWIIQTIFVLVMIGLPVALVFAWVFEVTPEGIKRESEVDRSQSIAPVTGRKLDRAIIAILVVALGWFAWDKFASRPDGAEPVVEAASDSNGPVAPAAAGPSDKSVAVLPFTTRSTSEEDRFFSDGMHDDLLTQLAKIGSLKVISRTSVMEYRDTTKNLRQIGQELGAAAILEGAVQRAGSQVRINVQLIDALTDEHLWAETYDRELSVDNLFDMQSEMARSIASAMRATLSPSEAAAIETHLTENLEALEAYRRAKLLSRYFFIDELKRAEAEIEHALELDPAFTAAWSLMAYIKIAQYWGVENNESYRDAAWAAIERGRELDPDFTELDIMEGYYHYWGFLDYGAALNVLEPLLPDNRNNVDLLQVTGWVNRRAGNWDKTLVLLKQAYALAPRDLRLSYSIGETYVILRQWQQAQVFLDITAALGPAHARTMQLTGDIIAGRDGDFATAQRYTGQAKQDQRFLAGQHWEFLLLADDYEGALEAAAFIEAGTTNNPWNISGQVTGVTHAYFGKADLAQQLLKPVKDTLEFALQEKPGDLDTLFELCETDAALGLVEPALEHCLAALDVLRNDAMTIPFQRFDLAVLLAWSGNQDAAMEILLNVARSGVGFSRHRYLAERRLDGLREHPDWPKMMQMLEPGSN